MYASDRQASDLAGACPPTSDTTSSTPTTPDAMNTKQPSHPRPVLIGNIAVLLISNGGNGTQSPNAARSRGAEVLEVMAAPFRRPDARRSACRAARPGRRRQASSACPILRRRPDLALEDLAGRTFGARPPAAIRVGGACTRPPDP